MFNNPFMYNQQTNIDRLNEQINNLEKMKAQLQNQQPPITQNFQLAPNYEPIKYANSMDDVAKASVVNDTPFFSKDMSVLWVKNAKGEIKTYELCEIIPRDDKDLKIEMLQAQINEMKGMIENAKPVNEYVDDTVKNAKSSNVSNDTTSTKKQK